jgi:hypothetical protein
MDWQEINHGRTVGAGAVFLILVTPLFLAAPVMTVLWLAGVGVAVAAVRFTVGAYRKWATNRFPAKYTDHPSGTVRFLAKLATGYASYLVGFHTVVALLGIVTVIGHFT